jgi:SH3-like domain-containing protein
MRLSVVFGPGTYCAVLLAFALAGPALPDPSGEGGERGPVTNLPLPRYVSLKTDKANVRRGPGLTQKVDWVFMREDIPLQIIAEYGNWRRVVDLDGAGGWMHYSMLSGVRTVIVQKDYTPLRVAPTVGAQPNAYAEQGVVAFLGACLPDWCQIRAGGKKGWALKTELWGVEREELRE